MERKSREADMLSDIENLDIMHGSNQQEREESEVVNLATLLVDLIVLVTIHW